MNMSGAPKNASARVIEQWQSCPNSLKTKPNSAKNSEKNFWAKISEKDLVHFPNPPNPNILPELISSTALFIIRLKNSVQKDIYSNIFV